MSQSVGQLIWAAAKPIVKLGLVAAGGIALSKAGILTAPVSKSLSKVIVYLLVPCLLFANISATLSTDNIKALGIIVLVALFYMFVSLLAGLLMKRFMSLPNNFRNGLITACVWGNWGDLPLAIVLSLGDMPPFKTGDSTLSIAYVSVLICVFNTTLFPLGGHRLVASDYPIDKDSVDKVEMASASGSLHDLPLPIQQQKRPFIDQPDVSARPSISTMHIVTPSMAVRTEVDHIAVDMHSTEQMDTAPISIIEEDYNDDDDDETYSDIRESDRLKSGQSKYLRKFKQLARVILREILSPANVAILLGLLVAFTPPLKRLFIAPVSSDPADTSTAPLAFLHEAITFVSAGCVPLSITNLGAALAKLEVRAAHRPSACGLVLLKLIVLPVLAVFAVDPLLVQVLGWVDPSVDRGLRFIVMLAGCVPTATTCLLLTQLYSPDGQAREIAAALLLQYVVGIFTMVGALYLILLRI